VYLIQNVDPTDLCAYHFTLVYIYEYIARCNTYSTHYTKQLNLTLYVDLIQK